MDITLKELSMFIGMITPVVGVLYFLFKIYHKLETNDKLTKANLKATKVMLDQFISDKIGNGEFKEVRQEIDEVLIYEK